MIDEKVVGYFGMLSMLVRELNNASPKQLYYLRKGSRSDFCTWDPRGDEIRQKTRGFGRDRKVVVFDSSFWGNLRANELETYSPVSSVKCDVYASEVVDIVEKLVTKYANTYGISPEHIEVERTFEIIAARKHQLKGFHQLLEDVVQKLREAFPGEKFRWCHQDAGVYQIVQGGVLPAFFGGKMRPFVFNIPVNFFNTRDMTIPMGLELCAYHPVDPQTHRIVRTLTSDYVEKYNVNPCNVNLDGFYKG